MSRPPARRRRSLRVGAVGLALLATVLAGCADEYASEAVEDAVERIEALGQEVEIVWVASADAPAGTVIESVELADSTVRLRVSSAGRIPVPDLTGLAGEDAERRLEDLGLQVRIRSDLAREGPFGLVTSSEPGVDALADPGATVTLFVREEERNRISGTIVLAADKDQLGAETLPTDGGEDSDDWLARGPSFAGERCWGRGLYSDLVDGAQFVVRDAEGSIVAKGELGRGRAVYVGDRDAELAIDTDWDCHFTYVIEDVPFSEFYAIETVRNTLTYAFDELEALDWQLDLTIPVEGPADVR